MAYSLGSAMRRPDMRPIADVGDLIVTILGNGRLHIDQADPRTLIATEVLDEVRQGRCNPDVHLDGELLYINGVNRQVVYRVGEPVPDRMAYRLEWPD